MILNQYHRGLSPHLDQTKEAGQIYLNMELHPEPNAPAPRGDCYKAAFEYMDKIDEADAVGGDQANLPILVHGDVVPISGPDSGRRINHAWIEASSKVYESAMAEFMLLQGEVLSDISSTIARAIFHGR